jgi:hypothetical protein
MRFWLIEPIKNRIGLALNSPIRKGTKKDFVFIHINKTGGTSIISITGKAYRKHLTVKDVIKYVGQKKWDKVYKFTVVRNPWAKVVSQYKFRTKTNKSKLGDRPLSFKDWVIKVFVEKDKFYYGGRPLLYIPQVEWLKDRNDKIDIDRVLRFENLNEEFKEVAEIVGISPNLPHLNSTKKADYRDFYDKETKQIIDNWFAEDILTFGYQF